MRRTLIERTLAAGSLALGMAWAGGAAAQQVIVDPQHIAQCLCLEQTLAQRASEMNTRRSAYDQLVAQLDQLETVAQHRASCGNRFYEQNVLERVRMTLVCPRG